MERFIHLLITGEESVTVLEEVEVIAVLEAGKRSLSKIRSTIFHMGKRNNADCL
jgi:hypothetical protein